MTPEYQGQTIVLAIIAHELCYSAPWSNILWLINDSEALVTKRGHQWMARIALAQLIRDKQATPHFRRCTSR